MNLRHAYCGRTDKTDGRTGCANGAYLYLLAHYYNPSEPALPLRTVLLFNWPLPCHDLLDSGLPGDGVARQATAQQPPDLGRT